MLQKDQELLVETRLLCLEMVRLIRVYRQPPVTPHPNDAEHGVNAGIREMAATLKDRLDDLAKLAEKTEKV